MKKNKIRPQIYVMVPDLDTGFLYDKGLIGTANPHC